MNTRADYRDFIRSYTEWRKQYQDWWHSYRDFIRSYTEWRKQYQDWLDAQCELDIIGAYGV
jgi:hypothetical protein